MARTLERKWEEALLAQRALEEDYARFQRTRPQRFDGGRARRDRDLGRGPADRLAIAADRGGPEASDRPVAAGAGGRLAAGIESGGDGASALEPRDRDRTSAEAIGGFLGAGRRCRGAAPPPGSVASRGLVVAAHGRRAECGGLFGRRGANRSRPRVSGNCWHAGAREHSTPARAGDRREACRGLPRTPRPERRACMTEPSHKARDGRLTSSQFGRGSKAAEARPSRRPSATADCRLVLRS